MFVFLALAATQALGNDACKEAVGSFGAIEGSVDVQRDRAENWQAATLDFSLCERDTIRVGDKSRAAIQLINDAVLRMDQNTTMRLTDVSGKDEERSLLDLFRGAIQSFSRQPRQLSVNSPYINGSIGTISYLGNGDKILLKERNEIFGNGCTAILEDFNHLRYTQTAERKRRNSSIRIKGRKYRFNYPHRCIKNEFLE